MIANHTENENYSSCVFIAFLFSLLFKEIEQRGINSWRQGALVDQGDKIRNFVKTVMI